MLISVTVGEERAPASDLESMPVYALGHPIELALRMVHEGSQPLTLKDPRTDQALLLWLRTPEDDEEIVFELNPARIDATGEVTAPPSPLVTLQPREAVETTLPLFKYCADRFLAPGRFEVRIELHDDTSPRFRFGIELRPESVPVLAELVLDETRDPWSREQALSVLRGLPRPPELEVVAGDEPEAEALRKTNQERAEHFLFSWPAESLAPEVRAFFEQCRLK